MILQHDWNRCKIVIWKNVYLEGLHALCKHQQSAHNPQLIPPQNKTSFHNIRRPRPTQGEARKGRRGVFPSGRAVWLCFCAVAAAAAANFLQVPCWPRPTQGGARQGIRHFPPTIWKLATAAATAAAAGSSRQQQAVTKPCSLYL